MTQAMIQESRIANTLKRMPYGGREFLGGCAIALAGLTLVIAPSEIKKAFSQRSAHSAAVEAIQGAGPDAVNKLQNGQLDGKNVRLVQAPEREAAYNAAYDITHKDNDRETIGIIEAQTGYEVDKGEPLVVTADKPYVAAEHPNDQPEVLQAQDNVVQIHNGPQPLVQDNLTIHVG